MIERSLKVSSLALLAVCLATAAWTQEEATSGDAGSLTEEDAQKLFKPRPYSPYAGRNFPTRPLFGDTHTHTGFLV